MSEDNTDGFIYPYDIAWEAFWQGYKLGLDTESTSDLDRRMCRSRFGRWWENNYE